MSLLWITNGVTLDGEAAPFLIQDGVFTRHEGTAPAGADVLDAAGGLVLPPFVEPHIHLDTALLQEEEENKSGTLQEGISIWSRLQQELTEEDVTARAETVIRELMANGVLAARAMVDISDPKQTALPALLALKERVAPSFQLQLTGFPQQGLSSSERKRQLEAAAAAGVDALSAVPHLEASVQAGRDSLAFCFDTAEVYGTDVHIFCDETDDPSSRFIETAAGETIRRGMQGRVTLSHCNAMEHYDDAVMASLLPQLKEAAIRLVVCPLINTAVIGRTPGSPAGRGIMPVRKLLQAGIPTACAHDDLKSPFYPLGSASMLQAAHMLAHAAQLTSAEEMRQLIRMISTEGAQIMGQNGTLEPCAPGDCIILPVSGAADALRLQPKPRWVVRGGSVLVETIPEETSFSKEGVGV
ncbi:amidohydrolase family protein [Alkalicoccus urumqiensis]|uniref:Cytosine deaminase n=1 Tax=Alkalicoccus urumqiensis TaxID=1548213 RepID=A0A2P6MJJ0_ALKUR|nr:amidohydrolase family protein [Alkalicoccus urumqiensis]PRO66433.1 cytosine deaminase [Alkalicoccus urumqiensis]